MALTDISGIGSKTAEKLRERGITTKGELFQAFRNGNPIVTGQAPDGLNSRAVEGIREELAQSESFIDPVYGVPVTDENQQAREAFDLRLGSDVAEGFGAFTRDRGDVDAGMNVLEAAGEAVQGNLGPLLRPQDYDEIRNNPDFGRTEGLREADKEATARTEAFQFGLDAAANLTDIERETLESGNELARQTAGMGAFTVEQTTTEMRETSQGTIEAEENMNIDAREYARARKFQQQRSPEAKRVDNRRKAPVTDEITTWKDDPSHYDYPGLDTPGGRQDIVTEDQREQAQQIDEVVTGAGEEVTEIAFGDPFERL